MLCAVLVAAAPPAYRHARAAALLVRLLHPEDKSRWVQALLSPTEQRELSVLMPDGRLRARLYTPAAQRDAPGIVLLHGVHALGIDEPRLVAFARALAASGNNVLTPELPELLAYRIDPSTTDRILAVARDHARRTGQRAVGVVGISFAGGLSLMAAAKEDQQQPIAFVVALGAHHDLMRLCRYYAGQQVVGPAGEPTNVRPHPYGARVMLREHLDHFFGPADLRQADLVLDTYLHDEHKLAQQRAQSLSADGRRVMAVLLDESRSAELGSMLMQAAAAAQRELGAASPRGKLARLSVPALLVHGTADPVIPSIETLWLAREVPAQQLRSVLVTPLLRHADFPQPPTLTSAWQVVHFIAQLLAAADAAALSRTPTSP